MICRPWSRKNSFTRAILGLLFLVLAGLWQSPLMAQVTTASLGGTVADATGAVIPGAAVTAKNIANGFVRTAKTNGVGIFIFSSLDSGDYTITVKAPGFETSVQKGIHLDPGDSRTMSAIKLVPGAAETETIVVNAGETAVLETGERSDLITAADLERLSTEGRDVTELLKILPGSAINVGNGAFGAGSANSNGTYDPGQVTVGGGSGSYSMSGAPTNGVSVRSDGVNLNDPASYSGSTQTVNTEATAEVKVQQSNFGADVANGPVVINAVGKSGSSTTHGSLYVHARTSELNTTDALATALGVEKPPDRYIYPGATLGGPLKFPGKDFNHNNKLIYFLQGEDYAQRNVYAYNSASEAIYHALVPTPNMLKGDFSPAEIQKYLPQGAVTCSGVSCATNPDFGQFAPVVTVPTTGLVPGLTSDNSPGGVHIDCSGGSYSTCLNGYMNQNALAIMKLLPSPNTAGGQTNAYGFNYVKNNLVNNDMWTAHARIDFAQSDWNKIYGVYTVQRGNTGIPQNTSYFGSGNSGGVNTPGGSSESTNSQTGSLHWTSVFSSTMTNEAYLSAAYINQTFSANNPDLLNNSAIGFTDTSAYLNGTKQFPTLQDYGYDGLPIGLFPDYSFGPIYLKRFTPEFGDDLTKVWGKHTTKMGVLIERTTDNSVNPGSGGIPTNGGITNYWVNPTFQLPTGPGGALETYANTCASTGCSNEGNLLASFLEGEVMGYNQANLQARINLYWWSSSFYATDAWKIRPNLTLTLGLRVEHQGEWQDAHHVGIPVFIPSTYETIDPTPTNPLPGFHWHAIDKSIPNSGQTVTPLFFDPRFGISWDIRGDGKTVLGGGYGWYRFHDNWNDVANALAVSEGQRTATLLNPYPTAGDWTNNGLTLDYIGGLHLDPANPQVAENSLATTGLLAFDQNDHKQPLTATYSLTLTQQVKNTTFSIGYVGNNSNSILNDGSNGAITVDNVNAIQVNGLFQPDPSPVVVTNTIDPATGMEVPKVAANPFAGTTWGPLQLSSLAGNSTPVTPSINDWRPYPLYGQLQLEAHKLFANYNGMQATLSKSKGWYTYSVNYTWSKALGVRGGYNNGNPGDSFNVWNDYGPLAYDRSQILNASYYVSLGNRVHGNKILAGVANGWAISGWTGIQSGPDLNATSYSPNFGLIGQLGPGAIPGSSGVAGEPIVYVYNRVFLGTPDVSLQPKLTCNPAIRTKSHMYINGACFQLPNVGGDNGPFIYPYMHGPAWMQSDLTVLKDIRINDRQTLQFSAAAFNFLNHPLETFSNVRPTEEQLDFVNGVNNDPSQATQVNGDFGKASLESGRRVLELSLKYTF